MSKPLLILGGRIHVTTYRHLHVVIGFPANQEALINNIFIGAIENIKKRIFFSTRLTQKVKL